MILSDHLSNALLDQDYCMIGQYLDGWFLVPFLVSKEPTLTLQFLAQPYQDCCSTLRCLGVPCHELSHQLPKPA